jgi:hypothetical protein
MSKSILTTISIFVISILVVVAGFFLLDIEKTALHFWAFGSLLFSLVVSLLTTITFVAPKKNKDSIFYTVGLSGAGFIYEMAVVISLLFTKAFVERLNSFIFLQIAINALFFICVAIIISVSGRMHDNNVEISENIQDGKYNKPKRGGF